MGVRRISRHIAHDAQLALGGLERVDVDKVRNLGGQVDAVDEDVALDDLLKGAALGRLRHVPLEDLLGGQPRLEAQIDGAAAAAAQRADDDDARQLSGLGLARGEVLLDVGDQRGLVRVALDPGQRRPRVRQLPRPGLERQRAATEARLVPERGHAPARRRLLQELEVQERAAAAREARQHRLPAALLLVAVGKLDVHVLQGD